MKYFLFLLTICFLFSLDVKAVCVNDDFSTDPFASQWTRSSSTCITWDSANQEIDYAGGSCSTHKATYLTALEGGNTDVWAQVQIGGSNFTSNTVLLRKTTTDLTGNWYEIEAFTSGPTVYWYHSQAGSQITLQQSTFTPTLSPGDWYAVRIEGTGTANTQVSFWACGATPCGSDPEDPTTWGAATVVLSSPSWAGRTPIDSGSYVGIGWQTSNSSNATTTVRAGGINCAAGGGGGSPSPPRRNIIFSKLFPGIISNGIIPIMTNISGGNLSHEGF